MSDKIQPKRRFSWRSTLPMFLPPSLPAMCRAGKSVTGSKAVKRRKNIFRTKRSNSKEAYLNLRPLFWVSVGFIGGRTLEWKVDVFHQKLNGTESQWTPTEVAVELLDAQVFSGSVQWVLLEISWMFTNNVMLSSYVRTIFEVSVTSWKLEVIWRHCLDMAAGDIYMYIYIYQINGTYYVCIYNYIYELSVECSFPTSVTIFKLLTGQG